MKKYFYFFTKISLKLDPKGPIDNNSALVYIMPWRQIGNKPLSEPLLTRSTDTYKGGGGGGGGGDELS